MSRSRDPRRRMSSSTGWRMAACGLPARGRIPGAVVGAPGAEEDASTSMVRAKEGFACTQFRAQKKTFTSSSSSSLRFSLSA
jgi:hypothetical protein